MVSPETWTCRAFAEPADRLRYQSQRLVTEELQPMNSRKEGGAQYSMIVQRLDSRSWSAARHDLPWLRESLEFYEKGMQAAWRHVKYNEIPNCSSFKCSVLGFAAAFHGVTLPFGGAKGAALALVMDIFSGLFTGAAFGGRVRSLYNDAQAAQDVGPNLFLPSTPTFKDRMDELVSILKRQPCAEGFDEILMPGEPESREEERRKVEGVPLQEDVVASLVEEAQKMGLTFPEPLD
eukprot:s34_g15.t1